MIRLGYCCINLSLGKKILVSRTMRKATFLEKGIAYASQLAVQNLEDLKKVLEWNASNDVHVYRMSSQMFPWDSEYKIEELPDFQTIKSQLEYLGTYAKANDMRLSFHPGPFNVLGSDNPNTVRKTIHELNGHAHVMDLMGLEQSTYYPLNIHVASTKPTKEEVCLRFCKEFEHLSDSAKSRLVVENDDEVSQYSVKFLYDYVYKNIGVPITYDQHHFLLGDQDQSMPDAINTAFSTWNNVRPLIHMSSSSKLYENSESRASAHADYLHECIQTSGYTNFDVEIEAKAKDLALLKYRQDFCTNPSIIW